MLIRMDRSLGMGGSPSPVFRRYLRRISLLISLLFLAGLVFAFSVVLRVLPGWAGLGGGIPTYAHAVVLSARFRTRTG